MRLDELLHAEDIVFGLRAPSIGEAAAQLLGEVLPKHGFSDADTHRLVEAVLARERELPTLCGQIAIPHARDAALSSFVAGVGINPGGVIEGRPEPRVLIAFLSPEQRRSDHLALLASLAQISRNKATIDAIASAHDANDVMEFLRTLKGPAVPASSNNE